MSRKNILCVVSICFVSSLFCCEAKSSNSCPLFSSKPSNDAYSPINIKTKDAIPINTSTPITVTNGLFGPLFFKNTGKIFEAYANPFVFNGGQVHGGVLCDEKFILYKIRHWISKDPNGHSYNQIDGKGSPVTLAITYFNIKYGSFEEALKHTGGVVILDVMVTHGPVFNPFFFVPDFVLRFLLRYPTIGPGLLLGPEILFYLWFDYTFYTPNYYAFLGSYSDLETGKEYPNVVHIQPDRIFPLFTKFQLGAFQALRHKNGTRLNAVAPIKPVNQPIYLGEGRTEFYSLI